MPNRPPSEPSFPPSEEPLHAASSLPIGLPTPERPLSPSGSLPPPPQPLPNRLRIIRRIRIHPLRPRPRLRFPRRPPAPPPADGDRAHSQAPPPPSREAHLRSPKRALWSLFASHAHRSLLLPRVCPKIVGQLLAVVLQRGEARQNWDTPPSPLFRLHPCGINRHRLHLPLPQRIPPVQKGWQDPSPDPLLLEFQKPPPGRRIGAIWARPIAPPAACNPHIQDPVEDHKVLHPRSPGFGPGWQERCNEGPRFIGPLLKPHRPSPPRQVVQRQGILQLDTWVLR